MVYNHETLLAESLDSLLQQTYQNFALLIVDDASTDRSFDVACGYRKKFKHCTLLRNDCNRGAVGNFHYSMRLIEQEFAQAQFFLLTSPDDTWSPQYLENTRDTLLRNPAAVVCQSEYDMLFIKTGKKTTHILRPLSAVSYRDARNVFYSHGSSDAKTHYNNMMHGLIRYSELRNIFPQTRELLLSAQCVEISIMIAMLLRGNMTVAEGVWYHKKKLGRFVDLHQNDELTISFGKFGYRLNAVMRCLPWLLSINRTTSTTTVLLLWTHLAYYYVFLLVAQRTRAACRELVKRADRLIRS